VAAGDDDDKGQERGFVLLKQLVHNGVVVPVTPVPDNLILAVRGQARRLTPAQAEMAMAWARKQGTPYVEDPVFVRNFLGDFSAALGIEPPLRPDEVDFTPAIRIVEAERAARERLTKEARKALAAERKAQREELRARYGHAIVDGQETELGTYLVEPSSIFMGRGTHPLRGRWKPGPTQRDITLNLSPDAPKLAGDWADIVWQPDSMWIARWQDKLSGKTKYIWLADTASIKQSKEEAKFDKAQKLDLNLEAVRRHIEAGLKGCNAQQRMVATACYLIDCLCLRVGDEKDPDEADTVGATTLRPEHVELHEDETVEFRFLGKDSVLWHRRVDLPEAVRLNLAELVRNARPSRNGQRSAAGDKPQLFPDVSSRDVNAFLGKALKGLTAKVFRTHHATEAVYESLEHSGVQARHPVYKKREAVTEANLAAAKLCNHYKQAPANWEARRAKAEQRACRIDARVDAARADVKALDEALATAREQAHAKAEAAATPKAREKAEAAGKKRVAQAQKRRDMAQARLVRAREALARFKSQAGMAARTRTWNLGTSLKSYIDPRVYYHWGQKVEYDVLAEYYPTTLQRKFAWVRARESDEEEAPVEALTE